MNYGRRIKSIIREHAREAKLRQRELEKRLKEEAKLSALEQARLEVEAHENQIELLLSIHKEQTASCDWIALLSALPPPKPLNHFYHSNKAKQRIRLLPPDEQQKSESILADASKSDEDSYREALDTYAHEITEWQKFKLLASRVLSGESAAYKDALFEFNPFAEIAGLGTKLGFKVHDRKTLICFLKVKGLDAIPTETKALTSTGKVTVKPMPKARYHELYQDYLCGCILRVGREVHALLPIETVLITASADVLNQSTGHTTEQPVFSVAFTRSVMTTLDFDRLDPSEAMSNFIHRGDFKGSRKAGVFKSITPLTPSDLTQDSEENADSRQLISRAQALRAELKAHIEKLVAVNQVEDDED